MPKYTGLLGDTQAAVRRTNVPNDFVWRAYVAIGATGAPTVTTIADSNGGLIAVSRNSTGSYAVTYPVQPALATSVPSIRAWVAQSAATTVAQAFPTAFAPLSGTATIITALNAAGTPVDPANGDVLTIEVYGSSTTA